MDAHAVLVCVFAIAFLLGVSGLGDKRGKKQARRPRRTTTRQPRQRRDYQTLPRPRRRH